MLVLEIAGGVVLGLLLYRGLDGLSKRANMTLPATIFSVLYLLLLASVVIGFLTLVVAGFYLMAVRPEDATQYLRDHHSETMWAIVIFLVLGIGHAAWSDLSDHKKSKIPEGQ
jgi:small-conductance mechanosensitive channel